MLDKASEDDLKSQPVWQGSSNVEFDFFLMAYVKGQHVTCQSHSALCLTLEQGAKQLPLKNLNAK